MGYFRLGPFSFLLIEYKHDEFSTVCLVKEFLLSTSFELQILHEIIT